MPIANELQVKRYLNDLLVKLEISKGDENTLKEIAEVVNYYKDEYPSLIEEYHEKGNEITNQFRGIR